MLRVEKEPLTAQDINVDREAIDEILRDRGFQRGTSIPLRAASCNYCRELIDGEAISSHLLKDCPSCVRFPIAVVGVRNVIPAMRISHGDSDDDDENVGASVPRDVAAVASNGNDARGATGDALETKAEDSGAKAPTATGIATVAKTVAVISRFTRHFHPANLRPADRKDAINWFLPLPDEFIDAEYDLKPKTAVIASTDDYAKMDLFFKDVEGSFAVSFAARGSDKRVFFTRVVKGGRGERAGVWVGDQLLTLRGKKVFGMSVPDIVNTLKDGRMSFVPFTVRRYRRVYNLVLETPSATDVGEAESDCGKFHKLHVLVTQADQPMGMELHTLPPRDMVVVKKLLPGGRAEAAGLQPGDILFSIGGTDLEGKSLPSVLRVLRQAVKKTVKTADLDQPKLSVWFEVLRARAVQPPVDAAALGEGTDVWDVVYGKSNISEPTVPADPEDSAEDCGVANSDPSGTTARAESTGGPANTDSGNAETPNPGASPHPRDQPSDVPTGEEDPSESSRSKRRSHSGRSRSRSRSKSRTRTSTSPKRSRKSHGLSVNPDNEDSGSNNGDATSNPRSPERPDAMVGSRGLSPAARSLRSVESTNGSPTKRRGHPLVGYLLNVLLMRHQPEEPLGFQVAVTREGRAVFVSEIRDNSVAQRSGLRRGDELLEVGGNDAKELAHRGQLMHVLKQSGVVLPLIVRRTLPDYSRVSRDSPMYAMLGTADRPCAVKISLSYGSHTIFATPPKVGLDPIWRAGNTKNVPASLSGTLRFRVSISELTDEESDIILSDLQTGSMNATLAHALVDLPLPDFDETRSTRKWVSAGVCEVPLQAAIGKGEKLLSLHPDKHHQLPPEVSSLGQLRVIFGTESGGWYLCRCPYCGLQFRSTQAREKHEPLCDMRLDTCPYCAEGLAVADLREHVQSCCERPKFTLRVVGLKDLVIGDMPSPAMFTPAVRVVVEPASGRKENAEVALTTPSCLFPDNPFYTKDNRCSLFADEKNVVLYVFGEDEGYEEEMAMLRIEATEVVGVGERWFPLRLPNNEIGGGQILLYGGPKTGDEFCRKCHVVVSTRHMEFHLTKECRMRPVSCQFCQREYGYADLLEHEPSCAMAPVVCKYCGCELPAARAGQHQETCDMRPAVCQFCEQQVPFREHTQHELFCTRKPIPCQFCRIELPPDLMGEHELGCSYKPASCPYCSFTFTLQALRTHLEQCGKRLIRCEICGSDYAVAHATEHESACGAVIAICGFCGDEFSRLKMEGHQSLCPERPRPCEYCNENFKLAFMSRHMDLCSMRPTNCRYCKFEFKAFEVGAHEYSCEANAALHKRIAELPADETGPEVAAASSEAAADDSRSDVPAEGNTADHAPGEAGASAPAEGGDGGGSATVAPEGSTDVDAADGSDSVANASPADAGDGAADVKNPAATSDPGANGSAPEVPVTAAADSDVDATSPTENRPDESPGQLQAETSSASATGNADAGATVANPSEPAEEPPHGKPPRPVLCLECGHEVMDFDLPRHISDDCPNRRVTCELCGVVLKVAHLTRHRTTACGGVKVECDRCSRKIARNQMAKHLRRCGNNTMECEECGLTVSIAARGLHRRGHVASLKVEDYLSQARPCFGVEVREYSPMPGMPSQGLLVTKVESGSPVWKAGIQVGDVICKVGDLPTNTKAEYAVGVSAYARPGVRVSLGMVRNQFQAFVVDVLVTAIGLPADDFALLRKYADNDIPTDPEMLTRDLDLIEQLITQPFSSGADVATASHGDEGDDHASDTSGARPPQSGRSRASADAGNGQGQDQDGGKDSGGDHTHGKDRSVNGGESQEGSGEQDTAGPPVEGNVAAGSGENGSQGNPQSASKGNSKFRTKFEQRLGRRPS
eukprot:Rmarinus@m.25547